MPSGTALLQSPGGNEGKARYETLGKHIQNKKELRRGTALSARVFVAGSAAPHRGSMNVWGAINPGLAPWAMREYRPYRAHLRLSNHILMRLLWHN